MRTYAEIRAEAERLGPLLPAPPPTSSMLGVGWSVWELAPADSDYWPRGGVIVHGPWSMADPETGEAHDRVLVVRADRGELAFCALRADHLAALDDASRPNASTIRGVCQVAARELARSKRKPDDRRALELWSMGQRLMAVLGAPGSVAP